ncbi:hypothetical protein [Terriglobus aquaticus]|uniref:CcmD family protein n=1 Tax=Terriglobus aquaticus TaxID=940139 RepID=A0ABW9KKX1_9BACT|nr:hypothetical protein [Terriglobus aquaticus]
MRNRILLLLLFASLLGTPVLLHRSQRIAACANLDAGTCAMTNPDPWWMVPLGVLSLLVLGYAAYVLAADWSERRKEKDMLDAVGVHVKEEDLPLEE